MKNLIDIIEHALMNQELISCTWSNLRSKSHPYRKITGNCILLKNTPIFQVHLQKDAQILHQNLPYPEVSNFIQNNTPFFKQVQIYTTTCDYHCLINKKGVAHIQKQPATKNAASLQAHNRQKNYLLNDPKSYPFLKALGLMNTENTINPSQYDKYKQINKYLEFVEGVIDELPQNETIRIVDFGCGKSYLTFALYHYLKERLGLNITVVGLDLKKDVIEFCNNLAIKLHYTDLKFQVGDIGAYTTNQPIHMVVSLHACNTATDKALAKALEWQSPVIFAVPCCHHEAYTQIENDLLQPILKHGILKERIAALFTDGLRAHFLEGQGYKVQVMEFIDLEHTPKNILIKAIRKDHAPKNTSFAASYQALSDAYHLDLSLPHWVKNS